MHTIRLSVALLLLSGTVGCGKNDSTPSNPKDAAVPTAASGESNAAALGAAKFLKAVQDGKATSDMLAPAFKKVIAPAELDADKAAGFSESGVRSWLADAKATAKTDDLKVDVMAADYAVLSTPKNASGRTVLRLVKSGTVWLVTYAKFGVKSSADVVTAAHAATVFFEEAIIAGNKSEIEAMLSKAAKAKLAAPGFDEDKPQGFSRSRLNSALADLFPAGFKVVGVSSAKDGLSSVLKIADGSKNRVLELKLAPGTSPGEFLIDDIQPQK